MVKTIKTRQQHNKMDLNFGVSVAIMNGEVTSETSLLPGECCYNVDDQSPFIERLPDAVSRSLFLASVQLSGGGRIWLLSGWHTVETYILSESSCFQVICPPPLSSTEPRDEGQNPLG